MKLIEYGLLTPERRAELEGDETDPFEVGGVTLRFRPKERHVGLEADDGTLVANTGLVMAEVEVGDDRFPVAGIGGVIVRAPFRGRGLARQVIEATLERAESCGPDFALLFCRGDRAGLYQRLGFAEVDGEVLVEQPGGYQAMPLHTMWKALRSGARWPAGQLVLHGLPF